MGRPINDPTHPVVDDDPTVGKVFRAFRTRDWQNMALATGGSLPFGYYAGRPVLMVPSMYMSGAIGAMFGLFLGFQRSFARLTGYRENSMEVHKYAKATTEPAS